MEAGTTTPLAATIYAGPTGGATLTNPFFAEANGNYTFYLDSAQDIKVVTTGVGVGTLTEDYERVQPAASDLVLQNQATLATLSGGLSLSIANTTGVAAAGVLTGGTGYSNSFAVTFTGGGGSGAAGTATAVGGVVQSIAVTLPGSGYTSAPVPVFTAGGGTGATGGTALIPVRGGLHVDDRGGDDLITSGWTGNSVVGLTRNDCVMVGTPLAQTPVTSTFLVNKVLTGNPTGYVTSDHLMDVRSGPSGDHGALRAYIIQTSGSGSDIRAFEPVAARITGDVADWTWGVESSVNSLIAPTGPAGFSVVGMMVKGDNVGHFGTNYPGPGATAVYAGNAAYLSWGRNGWDKHFSALDTLQAPLWWVDGNGRTNSKGELPLAHATHSSGSAALKWLAMYSHNFITAGPNAAGSPPITLDGDTNTGIGWPAADQVGLTAGAVYAAIATPSGLYHPLQSRYGDIATPGSPPGAGDNFLYPKSTGYFYRMDTAGVEVQLHDSLAPRARVFNSANISVANSTHQVLTFNSETYDNASIHSTVTNTDRLVVPEAGLYGVGADITFASGVGNSRFIIIYKNGTAIAAQCFAPVSGQVTICSLSMQIECAATDFFQVTAFQDSGGALNVTRDSDYSPVFWCGRIT